MRNTSPRWRRFVDCLVLATVAVVTLRRRERTGATAAAPAGSEATDDGPEMAVELERVNVGDELSVTGGGLDPTVVADVLELNEEAAELVDAAEEGFIREPIETATGAEVPDVEDELARRVRESTVSETAIDELETLGSLFGLGGRRRRGEREGAEDAGDGGGDDVAADEAEESDEAATDR